MKIWEQSWRICAPRANTKNDSSFDFDVEESRSLHFPSGIPLTLFIENRILK